MGVGSIYRVFFLYVKAVTYFKNIEFINQMVYTLIMLYLHKIEDSMNTFDMIKELYNKENISVSELSRRINRPQQNFGKKLKRDTII